eukprot:6198277-Pleurochrysis_carterae.AAC.2
MDVLTSPLKQLNIAADASKCKKNTQNEQANSQRSPRLHAKDGYAQQSARHARSLARVAVAALPPRRGARHHGGAAQSTSTTVQVLCVTFYARIAVFGPDVPELSPPRRVDNSTSAHRTRLPRCPVFRLSPAKQAFSL